MKQDTKGLIAFILIVAFAIFIVFCFVRILIPELPRDKFCETKYGEGFFDKSTIGSRLDECISIDYETGEAIIKYYMFEDLHTVCSHPKFFDITDWSWNCLDAIQEGSEE